MEATAATHRYRRMACSIRELCSSVSQPQVREELESLAAHFDRLADFAAVQRRSNPAGRPTEPTRH
ncbi:MAG: hypothetical protein JO341_01015 [Gammaproteobacteria bacterium]|nr:hypothetical protein [Gammaproteobacteria bacterium]MBV9619581.1 hypothetical protein [Gammaproteobacteria bacterium]